MNEAVAIDSADPTVGAAVARAPLIELRDITKTYVRGDVATEVLHGISIDIHAGEFVAIMGASGSGKSTLMNLIGLLDRPTSGSYRFAGEEVANLDSDRRALLRREAFGFIFQQYNLLAAATATENVEVPAIYAGLPHTRRVQRARELLTTLGLGERLDHRPSQLSGGQQQRVSIARALMNGGSVILADEPTGALDSKSGEEVMRLLHDLNAAGHTVLLITHDPDVAAQARRIIEIKDGHVVADRGGTPSRAEAADALQRQVAQGSTVIPDTVEAAKMALRSLRANLMRTLLTLLGIIIGVASVVAMLAIGDGAKQQVLNRITAMGTDLLLIRPGAPNIRMAGALTATLVAADADAIDDLPNVSVAVPEYPGQVTLRYQSRDYVTQANGTTQFFPQARDWPVAGGTFFSESDVKSYAPVVALGQTVVRALYPEGFDPVGTFVLVNNVPFQVIGVMSAKGASPSGADQDDIVFTPISTGALRLFGQRYVRSITVQVDDVSKIDDTQEAIRQLLIARHKAEDFQIRNMASILEAATETQNTLTILLGSIAAISLLVGGIGVMNIMLVSVTERTREIGIRMATGARRFNILLQFNTEALVVCAIGGLIGVVAGLGAAWGFAQLGRPVVFSAGPVILAFACAFATGLLFGYLPARKAANLDPVVALAAD
ncbi:MAG TPA: MacB family efflux pump subunit [Vineibacter sp.]|nr:MacB family efflux pump subunit [Vineibacter sp.]